MDRRTALKGLIGATGAGVTLSCSDGMLAMSNAAAENQVAPALPSVRLPPAGALKSISLAQVPIGAGGFVSGIEISADGDLFLCRTDVGNAYFRGRSDPHWTPLFTTASMQERDYDPLPPTRDKADGLGVAGIRIAPTDKNVLYASFRGYVWKSTDGGRTVRRTALKQVRMLANTGWQRLFNPTIDVHPDDAAAVIVGTWGEGVWFTTNGGADWQVADLPPAPAFHDSQPGLNLVLFDPDTPGSVYVFVMGIGLFRSRTGPEGKFEQLAGGPKYSSNIVAGRDGSILVCEHTRETQGGQVWRFVDGGGWSSARPDQEAMVLALDPKQPDRALLIAPYGAVMRSEDGCRTFETLGLGKWVSGGGEIRWMGSLESLFPAQARFDPVSPNRLWIAQGVGVAKLRVASSTVTLEDWSAGIEELCASYALCVPGGQTFLSAWDKPFWRVDSLTSFTNDFRYPPAKGTSHDADVVAFASYMDFAPEDPKFLVGVVAPGDKTAPGFTADGGNTWSAFDGAPAGGWGVGGCIAAASRSNFIHLPSNNGVGVFTLDGGKSWSPVKLDGGKPTDRFANAYYVARKNITSDKSRPGTFAVVYTIIEGEAAGNPLGGLWLTRDGGRTWSQQTAGVIGAGKASLLDLQNQGLDPRQFWQCQLDFVPGRSGEIVYTPHADSKADRFYWSQDDGRTWAELHKSIRNVRAFGFGRAAPGQTRPTCFFWGDVRGRSGFYVSLDWFAAEPQLISRFPSPMLAEITCIGGDLDRFGRAYVGTSCAGWVRVDLTI